MELQRPAHRLLLLMALFVVIRLAVLEAGAATLRRVNKYAPLALVLGEERRLIVGDSFAMEILVLQAVTPQIRCRLVMTRVIAAIAVLPGRLHVLEHFAFLTRSPWRPFR